VQTHRRTNDNAINRQRAERNPYRGRVAAPSTADASRVTADCALDAIIPEVGWGLPPRHKWWDRIS